MPSQAEIEEFQNNLRGIAALAAAEATGVAASVAADPPSQMETILTAAIPKILEPFLAAAAALAAAFYKNPEHPSSRRAAPGIPPRRESSARRVSVFVGPTNRTALADAEAFQPRPADPIPQERIESSVRWAVNADRTNGQSSVASRLASAVQRHVHNAARDTITANADAENVKWYRHARPNACAFCRLLATRGPKYLSEESALRVVGRRGKPRGTRQIGEKYHDHCFCVPVAVRAGDEYKPPDYVADWLREYEDAVDASDGSLKSIIREMRKNDPPRDRSVREEEVPAQDVAPAGILSQETLDAVAAARVSLPQNRTEWEQTTHGAVRRPAETVLERTIWEHRQRVADADARLAVLHRNAAFAPYEGTDFNTRFDRSWELRQRVEQLEQKLSRARSAKSIEKLTAQLETARKESQEFEDYHDLVNLREALAHDIDRYTNNPPTDAFWQRITPELREQAYVRDAAGNLLPTAVLDAHLNTVLEAGRRVRADIQRAIDADPEIAALRASAASSGPTLGASARRSRDLTAVARLEAERVTRALAEIRELGGHEQRATAARTGDLADLRAVEALYPTEWLQAADNRGPLSITVVDRAYFHAQPSGDVIAANRETHPYDGSFESYRQEVMAHELGHRMEQAVPGLTHLEYALVMRRGMESGHLEAPTRIYAGQDEFAYADRWINAYTGKTYATKTNPDPASSAHEAFQVGIQQTIGRGSKKFGDEELEDLVLGALALL